MAGREKIRRVFPGANTCRGFHSFYGNIIFHNEANRIFCLKGGPGTGKSSFMKSVASEFLNLGCDVECHHCSSDPNSLDAVVVKQAKAAILDGTAPHIVDPENPGAVDEILDFGAFWDTKGIEQLKDRILELNALKKGCFESAYRYLMCANLVQNDIEETLKPAVDKSKLSDLILDLKRELIDNAEKTGKAAGERHLFHSALTPDGRVSFIHTLADDGIKCCLFQGADSKAKSDMLKYFAGEWLMKGFDVEVFHQPLNPDRVETVLVSGQSLLLTTDTGIKEKACRIVDLDIALTPEKLRAKAGMLEKDREMVEALLQEAVVRLKAAKSMHGELEKLYTPRMGFEAVDELKAKVIDRIKEYL